jgi:plastocyanin
MKRLLLTAILLAAFVLPAATHATVREIHIMGSAFVPLKTKANYGDTIRWINMDGFQHNSVSDVGSPKTWSSGLINTGGNFQIVINPADGRGPFPYTCTIHAGMIDTIFVATKHQVSIIDFEFQPKGLVINPGDTVVWTNNGSMEHTSTSAPGSPKTWDSDLLLVSETFSLTFAAGDGMGPFPYHCTPHAAFMKDTIKVNPLFCGIGTTGNVNKSVAENPDLSDLSLLIAYLTQTPKPTLLCLAEANVNGSVATSPDLSDLSLLIAYLTQTPKPTLPNCPS